MHQKSPPLVCDIYGGKGGIGKTTLACAFAWHWAAKGATALMDADSQESTLRLHRNLKRPVPYRLAGGEHGMDLDGVQYVVGDMPPSIDEARPLLNLAHLIVVPVVLRDLDLNALIRTLVTDLAGMRRVALLSRVTHAQRNTARTVRNVLQGLEIAVLDTQVREYVNAHDTAHRHGIPVTHPDASGNKLAEAQQDLHDAAHETLDLLERM